MPVAARVAPWLLLLTGACTEYRVKGPANDVQVDSPALECDACAIAPQVGATTLIDPACNRPDIEVADPYDLAVKTELVVDASWPSAYGGIATPLVADLDGDGTMELAVADCAGDLYYCSMAVFDADGTQRWRRSVNMIPSFPLPGAVDLDGSDGAELVLVLDGGSPDFMALRADGSAFWATDRERVAGFDLTAADLRADGAPELLGGGVIFEAGTGLPAGSYDRHRAGGTTIAVADVDHDGVMEFAQGGALFAADGSTLWELPYPLGVDGMATALQADADPEPEFLFVRGGFVLVNADGTIMTQVDIPDLDSDYVVLADIDGDGAPELVFVTRTYLVDAYRLDGTLIWERDLGMVQPMVGWDVDGDGASEVIVQAYQTDTVPGALEIVSGVTGEVLFTTPNFTRVSASPLVADIDNDGHAELLVSGGEPHSDGWIPSVTIYHQVNDTWPAAGPAWPVPDFHISNVGPAGEIPRGETDPPAWTYNVFHARPADDRQGTNLTPSVVEACSDSCEPGGTVQLDVVVTNSGLRPAFDVGVRAYAGDTLVGETVIARVGSGESSAGTIMTMPGTSFDVGAVRIVVDPDGAWPECDEGDNEVGVGDPR